MAHVALKRHLYVYVRSCFLTKDNQDKTIVEGVLHGLYTPLGEVAYGHLLLSDGSHWCGIPLQGISINKPENQSFAPLVSSIQPWGNMGEEPTCTEMPYLLGMAGVIIQSKESITHTGMIIDWKDGGFVKAAQQHKPLHLIACGKSGNLALMPNNYLLFNDPSTIDLDQAKSVASYKRNDKRWFPENKND